MNERYNMLITLQSSIETAIGLVLLLIFITTCCFCALGLHRRRDRVINYRQQLRSVGMMAVPCVDRTVQADTSFDSDFSSGFGSAVTIINFVPPTVGGYEVEKKAAEMDVRPKLEESSDEVIVILPPTDDTGS